MPVTYPELEVLRKNSKISPVKQGANIPLWLRRKIKAVAKQLGLTVSGPATAHSSFILLQKILQRFQDNPCSVVARWPKIGGFPPRCNYRSLIDHHGVTKINDKICYVLEPYPYCEKAQYERELDSATIVLSNVFQCTVTWDANSWHYPGQTYRILFEDFC